MCYNFISNERIYALAIYNKIILFIKYPQIRTGLIMNFICVLITVAATSTWMYNMLNLSEYPCWADETDDIYCN